MTYSQSLEDRGGQPLGHQDNACFRKRKSQLNYMDIRKREMCQKILIKRNNLSVDPSSDDPY
jgi:hypothetical protein